MDRFLSRRSTFSGFAAAAVFSLLLGSLAFVQAGCGPRHIDWARRGGFDSNEPPTPIPPSIDRKPSGKIIEVTIKAINTPEFKAPLESVYLTVTLLFENYVVQEADLFLVGETGQILIDQGPNQYGFHDFLAVGTTECLSPAGAEFKACAKVRLNFASSTGVGVDELVTKLSALTPTLSLTTCTGFGKFSAEEQWSDWGAAVHLSLVSDYGREKRTAEGWIMTSDKFAIEDRVRYIPNKYQSASATSLAFMFPRKTPGGDSVIYEEASFGAFQGLPEFSVGFLDLRTIQPGRMFVKMECPLGEAQ